jgi:hypothetical protein
MRSVSAMLVMDSPKDPATRSPYHGPGFWSLATARGPPYHRNSASAKKPYFLDDFATKTRRRPG